jgi:uncharacterized protein YjlB
MTISIRVTPWASDQPPLQQILWQLMTDDGLIPSSWSNGANDTYVAHSHPYHKVIYVVQGSITFGLPEEKRKVRLQKGDRLDLPAGLLHDAVVGEHDVVCLEAHTDRG